MNIWNFVWHTYLLSPKQRNEHDTINKENGLHMLDHKLASACTLCTISESSLPITTSVAQNLNSSCENPEYVCQTVRLFEDTDKYYLDEPELLPSVKKPSYLGISCSLSGYSSLTSYDSKVREGFRTRDKSPAPPSPRLLSSMPNKEVCNGIESTLGKEAKSPGSHPLEKQRGSSATEIVNSSLENITCGVRTNGVHIAEQSLEVTATTVEGCNPQDSSPKSFVQQRIERLYGPGALAQGFLSRVRKNTSFEEPPKQVSSDVGVATCRPHLPVLRHLRPEFRAQLPLTYNSLKTQQLLHSGQYASNTSPPDLESSSKSLADFQPAAPDVPVIKAESPIIPSERSNVDTYHSPALSRTPSCRSEPSTVLSGNHVAEVSSALAIYVSENISSVEEEKIGHHFLKVLHKEIERLSNLADQTEHELHTIEGLSEDIQGKLRAASGQARLLMKQKLQQFEGLCNKNISQCSGEAFPTTDQDLEGFWDMVKLQIDHVDQLFSEIDILRKLDWKDNTEYPTNSGTINGFKCRQSTHHLLGKYYSSASPTSIARTKAKVIPSGTCDKKNSDSARRSREQQTLARKKLMEERRQALKAQPATSKQHVEIYIASRNGK